MSQLDNFIMQLNLYLSIYKAQAGHPVNKCYHLIIQSNLYLSQILCCILLSFDYAIKSLFIGWAGHYDSPQTTRIQLSFDNFTLHLYVSVRGLPRQHLVHHF